MKIRPVMGAALALSSTVLVAIAALQTGGVTANGCVEQGADSVCLLLRDRRSKKLYELLFKGAAARPGSDIRISGAVHHGPTICQQGVPVDVSAWTASGARCHAEPMGEAR